MAPIVKGQFYFFGYKLCLEGAAKQQESGADPKAVFIPSTPEVSTSTKTSKSTANKNQEKDTGFK